MARDLFEEAGFNSTPSEGRDLFAEAGVNIPQKRQASLGTALAKSFADVGNTADTAWSMLAGGAAGLFGQDEERDRIFKEMEERAQSRNQWANPNNEEIGFGGKLAGTLATLPMQIVSSGLSPASTGKTMIDAGEDASTAMKGAAIDAAGNAVGMLLPAGIGGSVAKQMATGAGLNAAQDFATKAAIQGVAKGAEAKRQFEPTLEDAFIAGTIGAAAGGVAGRQASQRAKANAPALDGVVLVPKNAEPAQNVAKGEQMSLFPEDAYQGTLTDQGPQFNATADVTPSRGSLSNKRQMELQMEGNETMAVTPEGTAFPQSALDPAARLAQDRAQAGRQNELFPNDPARGQLADQGPQFDHNAATDPARGALANARQMELQESGAPMRVTQEGVALPEAEANAVVDIKNRMQDDLVRSLDEEVAQLRNEKFLSAEQMELPRTETQMDLFGDVPVGPIPKDVAAPRINIEAAERQGFRFDNGVPTKDGRPIVDDNGKIKEIFQKNPVLSKAILEQQNLDSGGTLTPKPDMTPREWDTWKQTFPDKVDQFVEGAAADINNGVPYSQIIDTITDPKVRAQVEKLVEPAMKAPTISEWKPRSSQFRKQGGYVVIPGRNNKKPSVDQLKQRVPELFPERLPAKEWIETYGSAKDITTNHTFTKGGLLTSLQTGNPLIKRVTENIRQAQARSQGMIRDIVHDSYTPTLRKLSRNRAEYNRVFQVLSEADRTESNIDLGSLKKAGFSDTAIQVIRQQQDAMNAMEAIVQGGAAINGLQNVRIRTAFAASQAQGDFRRPVYVKTPDGEKKIVGYLGADTRLGLNKKVSAIQKDNPNYTIGDERYVAGGARRHGSMQGYSQLMELLGKEDPDIKAFSEKVNDILFSTENLMGAKGHTMEKKGIFGMTGRDPTKSVSQNANDFFDAQVAYMENVIQWKEMSEAVKDAKEVMAGVDMPKAKQYLEGYLDNALGRPSSEMGKAINDVIDNGFKAMGIGSSLGSKTFSGIRQWVNGNVLGLNPRFMLTQMIDPFKALPPVAQYLSGKGIKLDMDLGTGYSHLGAGALDAMKVGTGMPVSNLVKGAAEYAKRHHVYSSDLFDMSNSTRITPSHIWNRVTQAGASHIEGATRASTYFGMVDLLHKNGIGPKDGLYEAAHNLTRLIMNDYSRTEAPLAYSNAGELGRAPYNLMSYKHNELSKLALFTQELTKQKDGRALATALMAQMAAAGVMGMWGYAEADVAVKYISKALGKPTSLSSMLMGMEGSMWNDLWRYGAPSAVTGANLSTSLGGELGATDPMSMLFPAGGRILQQGGALADAVGNPTEWNLKNAAREALPVGLAGIADNQWFTADSKQGPMALSRNTGKATALRNEADTRSRYWGATGINESEQKTLNYEAQQVEKYYTEGRTKALTQLQKALQSEKGIKSKDWEEGLKKFAKFDGNLDNFDKTVEQLGLNRQLTPWQLNTMRNAAARSVASANKLKRSQDYESKR